jgi:hypothetical protein
MHATDISDFRKRSFFASFQLSNYKNNEEKKLTSHERKINPLTRLATIERAKKEPRANEREKPDET